MDKPFDVGSETTEADISSYEELFVYSDELATFYQHLHEGNMRDVQELRRADIFLRGFRNQIPLLAHIYNEEYPEIQGPVPEAECLAYDIRLIQWLSRVSDLQSLQDNEHKGMYKQFNGYLQDESGAEPPHNNLILEPRMQEGMCRPMKLIAVAFASLETATDHNGYVADEYSQRINALGDFLNLSDEDKELSEKIADELQTQLEERNS